MQHPADFRAQGRIDIGRLRRRLRDDAVHHGAQVLTRKRTLAGEDFVSHHAQGELVRTAIDRGALHLLRRHIVRRPQNGSTAGEVAGSAGFGDAEIRNAHRAVFIDHDVGRLDIAMHDAFGVGEIERGGGLAQDPKNLIRRDGLGLGILRPIKHGLYGGAIDELHGDEGESVFLIHVINGDDVGMRQDAGGARFAKQTLAQTVALFGVIDLTEANGFDGDGAPDGGVDGLIDDAHGTAAQLFDDLEAPDPIHQISVTPRNEATVNGG